MIRLCLLLLLSSCASHELVKARSEYLDSSYLASTQVRTPEPCYTCFVGEQVIVSWNLPQRYELDEVTLRLFLRFGDHEVREIVQPISRYRGCRIFRLLNADYWEHEGILSYSVRIENDQGVWSRFDHHLWQDIVHIDEA